MTNNLIEIKGGSDKDIKKAFLQWLDLYSPELESDLKFDLYKNLNGSFVIIADKTLENQFFFFLVNYLKYPEGIKCDLKVNGYTTITDNSLDSKGLLNKKVLVYLADNDTEYDNVFIATEIGEVFKLGFDGTVKKIKNESKTFQYPDINLKSSPIPETIKFDFKEFSKKESKNTSEAETHEKPDKKKLIFPLAFVLIMILCISLYYDFKTGLKILLFLPLLIGYTIFRWSRRKR